MCIFFSFEYRCSCGAAYCKSSEVFEYFAEFILEIRQIVVHRDKMTKLMDMHRLLYELALETEKVLSLICFLLFCTQSLIMYTSFGNYIIFKFRDVHSTVVWHTFSALILTPACLIGVILCASKISGQIRLIHTNRQLLYYTLVNESKIDKKILLLVRTMLRIEFPEMTAGNITGLRRKLILSIAGALFTYGMLLVSVIH
ncbi:uncharacterized protein NPIL_85951 [Nephila pilipes]|uniref:Uncharacterized protein n=1 Tax=Nephila pilipes TaxID=299642 RepID=A0A8X6TSA7_NEPPI|nr:uncharacterized protein NPIL_85951 [Nephila pilipes]